MGTLTANILIGSPHPNKDGIIPSHYMFLSENSAPSWTLVKENVDNEDKNKYPNIVWLPTVENMLEDGLLMVAAHVLKNHEILEMATDYTKKIESERLELYSDLDDAQRNNLYQKCRELSKFPKLIISVFRSSSIETQLAVLEKYDMDVEVCTPIYSRLYSEWQNEIRIEGSL